MNRISRTLATLFALVLGLVGLTATGSAAFAVEEPPGPTDPGTVAIIPSYVPASAGESSTGLDTWQMLVAAVVVAALAAAVTVLAQRLASVHHSHTRLAGA